MNPLLTPFLSYCRNQDYSFNTLEEGLQIVGNILQQKTLCHHDVTHLNKVYKILDQLERKIDTIPDQNSSTILKQIDQKIQSVSQESLAEQIITAYQLQQFEANLIDKVFTPSFTLPILSPDKIQKIAECLPFCGVQQHFDADVTALLGTNQSAEIMAILNAKKGQSCKHNKIQQRQEVLEQLREQNPSLYPSYLDEILDGEFFHLYDHLIAMKELSTQAKRDIAVKELSFSSFAHIILEFREMTLIKVEKQIPAERSNIVFLLGDTGSGKSTTLCYLRKDPMILQDNAYKSANDKDSIIGNDSATSCTLFPNIAADPNITLVDFPGFSDTHGQVISMAIELTLKALTKKYSPKIVLLSSITDTEARFKHVHLLGERLNRILGSLDHCILGLTKYFKDLDFNAIQNFEVKQKEEASRHLQQELKLEKEVQILSPLVETTPILQNMIDQKKEELSQLQQTRLSPMDPYAEERSKHLQALREKEEIFKKQIGIGKLISFADLTDQIELEKILQILKSQERITFTSMGKALDLEHKDLIGILFNRDFNCFIDPIEKDDSSPSSSPLSANISTSGDAIANSIKSSNPLSSSISTSEDAIAENIKAFEQNILEMSLINTILANSHPEIGKLFHLDEMDPAIVRKYDKAVITACINGYIGEVISDSLVNESIIIQLLKQSKVIDSELSLLKNYILTLSKGLPSNVDPIRLEKEWEQLQKEHRQQLNRKKEQFKLPKWMTAALLIPLGIPYGVFAAFTAIKLGKTSDKLSKDAALELSQKIKTVYQGIIALKDIENVVNKQDNIAKSFASNPLSLDSAFSLKESIKRQINQVKISYGEEDWDKRVIFLTEQFELAFSSTRSNFLSSEKILYALISQEMSCKRLPPYFNEHTFLALIHSFMISQKNYQETIRQLVPGWKESSYLDLKLKNPEHFFHISSMGEQELQPFVKKGQELFEQYGKTPITRLLLVDTIYKLWEEASFAPRDETEKSLIFSTENNRKKILQAVGVNPWILEYSKEWLSKDRTFILAAVQQNGITLKYASEELRNNRDFILTAVQQNGQALQFASEELRNNRDFILTAVQQNGQALQFASEELRNNRDFVLIAIKQNGAAFIYASEELRNSRDFILTAMRKNGLALWYAGEELKNDREVVLAAVQQNGITLKYASEGLKNDRELVLAAVQQNVEALLYAGKVLQSNRDFIFTTVQQNGQAFCFVSERLRHDRGVVLAAVQQNGEALLYASKALKNDREVVLTAVQQNGMAFWHASEDLRNDREVVLAAVQQNGKALQYASLALQNDPELIAIAKNTNS